MAKTRQSFETEMDAWLDKWGGKLAEFEAMLKDESANTVELMAEKRKKINTLKTVHKDITSLRDDMKKTPEENKWLDMKGQVEELMGSIEDDDEFRSSLAYFH